MTTMLEERVTDLESLMAQLIQTVDQTSRELREFKDESRREMREFKDEMRAFRDESRREMREFKDEMRASRAESSRERRASRAESSREIREFRRQLGEISRKAGTMAEDMVAPSIPRILKATLDCQEIIRSAVRVKSQNEKGESREFDVIAVCGPYLLVNETKSKLRPEDINAFVKTLPSVRDFFPEYAGKKIIGVIASLYVDESLVRYGERQGLVVLGFGQDVMEVLNSPGFKPKEF